MSKRRVFVDTNAIFPAVRIGEWKRLCGHFLVETVTTIVAETQNGNVNRKGYVQIEKSMLESTLASIHEPTDHDRAAFRLQALQAGLELDDGESDLLAYLLAHERPDPALLVLTMADRAAIRACCQFGWTENLVSLERLLRDAGAPAAALRSLEEHYCERWLSSVRTAFSLGLVK